MGCVSYFVTRLDLLLQILGLHLVHSAPHRHGRAKDLLHSPLERLGHRLVPHRPCDVDDLIEGDVAAVLNVLDLLPVPLRLLERLDNHRRGGGHELTTWHITSQKPSQGGVIDA